MERIEEYSFLLVLLNKGDGPGRAGQCGFMFGNENSKERDDMF